MFKTKSDEKLESKSVEKQKKLSSKEFLEGYEAIWKEGPAVKYRNIGSKEMLTQSINQNPKLW